MSETVLEMQGIVKSFPGVTALDSVNFSCCQSEVHALVGENGAGKSTLMKILSGAYHPDKGKILMHGKEVRIHSPKDAQKLGIATLYQEFNLIADLNVAENVFLGREPSSRRGIIDNASIYNRTRVLLDKLNVSLDLRTKIRDLSVAQQQIVEIVKALSLEADIIIMDEPTAIISGKELDSLFHVIRTLRKSGKTIIYISHRIEEIFQIADRVTVLRDGHYIGSVDTAEADKQGIIRMMVGRTLSETFPPKETGKRDLVLSMKGVSRGNCLRDVHLEVYSGEILGVAGLVGSGRTELARAIFCSDRIDRGEITLFDVRIENKTTGEAITRGIGFVTEDRKGEGIVARLSVRNNLTLPALDKMHRFGFLKNALEKSIALDYVRRLNIITPSIDQEIQYLSGGNQQKVILAKWLNLNPKLIILDEPTRGIDVGAKAEIYNLIRELAKSGTAIIMISSELQEIIGMSDRVIVMHNGQIRGELAADAATEEAILTMATGQV